MNPHDTERFWGKVIKGSDTSACWIWVGAIGDDGYGRFWTQTPDGDQRMLRAHRAAAEITHGYDAIIGHLVTHRAHTLTNGYDQHQVDELVRGIIMPGQQPLF